MLWFRMLYIFRKNTQNPLLQFNFKRYSELFLITFYQQILAFSISAEKHKYEK